MVTLQYDRANKELPHPLIGTDVQALTLTPEGLMVAAVAGTEGGGRIARLICVRGRQWDVVLEEDLRQARLGFSDIEGWLDGQDHRRLVVALGDQLFQGFGCRSLEPVRAPTPLHALHGHDGRLFAAPTEPGEPLALMMDARGQWSPAVDEAKKTSARRRITAFASHGGALYAAVADHDSGFEIWRSTGFSGQGAPVWETVLERGAYRYTLNRSVPNMVSVGDHLFIGTSCLQPFSIEDLPAAPEIIQIDADGGWEIVVGQPRFSPVGLKVPLSALPAGFGVTEEPAGIRLARHRDRLFALVQPLNGGPAQLWSSADTQAWERADTANLARLGRVRVMESTPRGLILAGSAAGGAVPVIRVE